ncbi:DUF3143 domain-containing protein [Limnofasciculus baicalensis]|uniref:DUF3143 domain-containing protein n=1 Tax=Limnofasciculus baicalensis BBK-W-15 TaxID=2699891 RepID=A0AAE3GZ44_9CYAN|nr:DUF3143 domain-containing protein [Limnofasciculus baicalensis]MCP2732702.1 DUF3143 domain-containing protein [Limnofasciculus baicalensis BBK-W-15]
MLLPPANTPLYNHPLNAIEQWLKAQGCEQDRNNIHYWYVDRATWRATLCLDIEELTVLYTNGSEGGRDIQRSFKYSLSRADIEAAVFSGP